MQRIIIDTDPGVDDALAIILALRSPEVRVEAITTVGGNVHVEQTTRNALLLLDLLDPVPRPPVARGAPQPLRRPLVDAAAVHGADGLGDLGRFRDARGAPRYPEPRSPPAALPGPRQILEVVRRFPGEVILVAVGPLTNVALALREDPGTLERLRRLVVMGGAVSVPGNITPAAEFNMFVDPEAAEAVFGAGLPLTLVGLDVTRRVTMPRVRLRAALGEAPGRVGRFLLDATEHAFEFGEARRGVAEFALHDPLAVGAVIDPSLVRSEPLAIRVETESDLTRGLTLADRRPIRPELKAPPNANVCLEVDAERFLRLFEERACRWS
jgi:purine nucleosidase/pyrimidine-specific ribonucleoside hydrolase